MGRDSTNMYFTSTFLLTCLLISSSYSTILQKRSLSQYPLAVCNDGTPATYYVSDQMKAWAGVVVYLQEGGGCASVDDCIARCEVDSPTLCTEDTNEEHDLDYTGTRNASQDTGNYFFHGKFIVEALIEDIARMVPGVEDLGQFVLTGGSAGAFGVGINCGFVAELVHAEVNPETDVRCIADGGDFYPTWVSREGCDPYQLGQAASDFWLSKLDYSCENDGGAGELDCLILPSYYQYIDTPMMVVTNYVDTSMEVHPCTPPTDQDTQFWDIWKDQMLVLANTYMQSKPLNGLFLSNCPFHVSVLKEFAWGDMDVQLAAREGSEVLREVVKNWLDGEGDYQALDLPTQQNSKCPY